MSLPFYFTILFFTLFYFYCQNKPFYNEKLLRINAFIISAFWILSLAKGLLQIPLPNHPHTYAMPSGHVYIKMAILMALLNEISIKKSLAYFISLIFGIIEGYLVVVNGYHSPEDAMGSIILASIQMLVFYRYIFLKPKYLHFINIFSFTMAFLVVLFMKFYAPNYKLSYIWGCGGVIIYILVLVRSTFLFR